MRLHDIISSSLLPSFAEDAEWEQNALDVFVKAVRALSFGLGAPYTRKAISALTDADLQAYFLAYGIISYYPELSRQTRENMLFELARMYRFLGTPYAITALCRYIFDESDAVEVEVKDNLAFDDDGELIDVSLLDLFDIAIDAQSASIGGSAGDRIVANVLKIARNSQALRNIYFRYEDELSIPVRCADYIGFSYRIGDDYELSRPMQPDVPISDFIFVDSLGKVTSSMDYDPLTFVEQLSYTAYRMSNKSPAIVNNYTGFSPLYDENAHTIAADSTKTYKLVRYYASASGGAKTPPAGLYITVRDGVLKIFYYLSGGSGVTVQRVEYNVS